MKPSVLGRDRRRPAPVRPVPSGRSLPALKALRHAHTRYRDTATEKAVPPLLAVAGREIERYRCQGCMEPQLAPRSACNTFRDREELTPDTLSHMPGINVHCGDLAGTGTREADDPFVGHRDEHRLAPLVIAHRYPRAGRRSVHAAISRRV